MKKIFSIILILVVVTSFAFFFLHKNSDDMPVEKAKTTFSEPTKPTNMPTFVATNSNGQTLATVDSSKRVVSLQDKSGKILWSVNVADKINQNIYGNSEIREIKFDESGDNLNVIVGKHTYVTINSKDGKCLFKGSD